MVPNALDWKSQFSLPDPRFLLDYENLPAVIPDALQSGHVRPSVATRWDANGDLVEDSAGTLRLQRDPATQAVQGLLYEPKRTQLLSSPQDITSADWGEDNVTTNDPNLTAKNQPYYELIEDSSSGIHDIDHSISPSDNEVVAFSAICKKNGREHVRLATALQDGGFAQAAYNLTNGSTISTNTNGATIVSSRAHDLENGWYRVKMVAFPDATDNKFIEQTIRLLDSTQNQNYTGDGTSGIYVMHAQAEVSREVTSPILTGGAVREADEVDYRFAFPDVTTGVAYSIRQERGNAETNEGFVTLGPTSSLDANHGALMDHFGLNDIDSDGWVNVTRNSDDPDTNGALPGNETIDRFKVEPVGAFDGTNTPPSKEPYYIVRQIAIWAQTLTSTQKTDLANNYLTQP